MTFEAFSVRKGGFIVNVGLVFTLQLSLTMFWSETAFADQKELHEEFWEKYPLAIERLKKSVENLECDIEFTSNSLVHHVRGWIDSAANYGKGEKATLMSLGSFAVEVDDGTQPGSNRAKVYCATPTHSFNLERSTSNTPYLIRYFGDDRSLIEGNQLLSGRYLTDIAFAAFLLYDLPIDHLLKDPSFRILSLKKLQNTEEELVEIQFELPNSPLWYESGRWVVAPADDWAVREYEVVMRSSGANGKPWIDTGRIEYQRIKDVASVFPRIVEVTRSHTQPGKERIHEKQTGKITRVNFGTVTADNFRLPAFGVSDIPLNGTRRRVWLIIGFAVAAIIFGLVYRRLRIIEK